MYKAILWDVDGTLLNFLKSENAAIKECFQHFGLPECTDEMVGVYSAINEGYWKLLERGEITKPELFTRRFRDFFGKIGVTCDEAEFNALYQRTLGSHIFPNDNGIELVRSLKGRVHQYAVTNGSAVAQERKLNGLPVFDSVKEVFRTVEKLIKDKKAVSVWSIAHGGVAEGIFKMSLGNQIGAKLDKLTDEELFTPVYGAFIMELTEEADGVKTIGETVADYTITSGDVKLDVASLEKKWDGVLEPIFKAQLPENPAPEKISYTGGCELKHSSVKVAKPRVLIPVFPGTNCEYDMANAFNRYGGDSEIFVIRNLSAQDMEDSVSEFTKHIENSQIIAIPGGFSGGDEPEGSAKFINAFFRNPKIKDAVESMLYARDGLMIGICNGFQALIKLGLVPFGKIVPLTAESPTLTYNTIGRHQSQLTLTRICTNKSPWLSCCNVGDIHNIPISHGEGRFVAPESVIKQLIANGQVATQYVDLSGNPTMDVAFNPNSSMYAIEGIISPDGRVLGKMGHTERLTDNVAKNVSGNKEQLLFKGGVDYFA